MEDVLLFVVGLLLGGIGMFWFLARVEADRADEVDAVGAPPEEGETTPGEDPEAPASEPSTQSARDRVWQIANERNAEFHSSSYPGDLVDRDWFREAVDLLAGPDIDEAQLTDYMFGDNPLLQCLSCAAAERKFADHGDLAERLCGAAEDYYPWSLWFALRVLDASDRPLTARMLLSVDPDRAWSYTRRFLIEHIERRLEQGEEITFANEDDSEELDEDLEKQLRELFRALGERGEPLLEDFDRWVNERIDTSVLLGIGRVHDKPEPHPVLDCPAQTTTLEAVRTELARDDSSSILIVSERGAGKRSVLRRLRESWVEGGGLVFEASASQVLAGQMFIGQLEGRVADLIRAIGGRRRVLWIATDLHEFAFAGRSMQDPTSVLDHLMPAIEAGHIRIVGSCDSPAFSRLVREQPRVRRAFEIIKLEAADESQTLDVARHWAEAQHEDDEPPIADEQLLRECAHLGQQYLNHLARPGSALELLQLTLKVATESPDAEPRALTLEDALEALGRATGLPRNILDDRERIDLDKLRREFERRVLGQPEAIDCLIERIALIKAGLTDPSRPLGVFLFSGPTGTGKTELAKTLAETLFGGSDRLIRLDMSEFKHGDALDRLLGSHGGIPGQDDEALVNKIRKQPFSVVLLDEVEKADPSVYDLFLQVFDDGRLADRRGEIADFRHSIVIMTSNLGATGLHDRSLGFSEKRNDDATVGESVQQALAKEFRPEFLNRLDRVIAFRPLTKAIVRRILDKELRLVLERRGLRSREWALEVDDSANEFLLREGFSPTLGARPLRRAIERHLLAPLARTIVDRDTPEGDQFLFVRADGDRLQTQFVDAESPATPQETQPLPADLGLSSILLDGQGDGDEVRFLNRAAEELGSAIRSEEFASAKAALLARTGEDGFWESDQRFGVLAEAELRDRLERASETMRDQSTRLTNSPGPKPARQLAQQIYLLDRAIESLREGSAQDAWLEVRLDEGEDEHDTNVRDAFDRVADMYRQWARRRRMQWREHIRDDTRLLATVSGFGAYRILTPESGVHLFEDGDSGPASKWKVRVHVAAQDDARPTTSPKELMGRADEALASLRDARHDVVRRYRDKPSPLVRDRVAGWRTGRIDLVLGGEFDLM